MRFLGEEMEKFLEEILEKFRTLKRKNGMKEWKKRMGFLVEVFS